MVLPIFSFIVAASMAAWFRYQILLKLSVPWGTLAVNLIGSVLIGFLAIILEKHYPQAKVVVLVAFLGSLTTFSTYSFDLVKLFEGGLAGKAFLYMVLSNGLCFGGCLIGFKLAQNLVNTT